MPIRPEFRQYYKAEWRTVIRPRILERDGHRCKRCGKPDRVRVKVMRDGSGRWLDPELRTWRDCRGAAIKPPRGGIRHKILVILTVAHLDHQPWNNDDGNLAALCQHCHIAHDSQHHYSTRRRIAAELAGQMFLFDGLRQEPPKGGESQC
jgi:hypothetical protein